MTNIYSSRPRQIRRNVERCFNAGLVPFVKSSPGIGKSSIMRAIAKDYNLELIDIRLSMCDPTDLNGLPTFDHETGRAKFMPFDMFPVLGTPLPKGKNGWLMFFDEFNSAPKSIQAASYKIILDHMVGMNTLHENVFKAAAGNLSTDRAIVNPLSTAMQSRVIHMQMEANFDDWLRDVALPQNYDSRIIAFLSMYPSRLMDFRPDHEDNTFCCPRTWEFMDRLTRPASDDGKRREIPIVDEDAALFAGTITSGTATDFVKFVELAKDLVSFGVVVERPAHAPIPDEVSAQWATVTRLIERVTDETLEPVMAYLDRYEMQMRVLAMRAALVKNPDWIKHKGMRKSSVELAKYLWTEDN